MQQKIEPTSPQLAAREELALLPEASDFCLGRIGGLPSTGLKKLIIWRTQQSVEQILEQTQLLQELASALEPTLYRILPHVAAADKALSRRVLAAKRHIHNVRLWEQALEDSGLFAPFLTQSEHEELVRWYRLAQARDELWQQAVEIYQQEVAQIGQALRSSMHDSNLGKGLVLANRDVYRAFLHAEAAPREEHWQPGSKLARTAFSYITRAAMKTSPFSTFTRLAQAEFQADPRCCPPQALPAGPSHAVQLARSLSLSWLMALAHHPHFAPLLTFEPNQGITFVPDDQTHISVLTGSYVYYGEMAGRDERLVKRRFDTTNAGKLEHYLLYGTPLPYPELLTLLQAESRFSHPQKTFLHLLDMQLIRPVAPYQRQEERPLLALASIIDQSPAGTVLATLLRQIQSCAEAIAHLEARERLDGLETLKTQITQVFEALQVPIPAWATRETLLYEDVRFDEVAITLPRQIQEDVRQFAQWFRPRFVRTRLYDYCYQYFLKRYGPVGEVENIQLFLQQFFEQPDTQELVIRASAEDWYALHVDDEGRAGLSPGASGPPPCCTIFFQIAAEDAQALARGEYHLVINQINSGQGGLFSRFQQLFKDAHAPLSRRIQSWIAALHDGKHVVELPVVGDWNNLQAAQGLLEQTLQWPAELSTRDENQTIHFKDLRMRANVADETLYIVDRTGQVLAPSYLGTIPSQFSPTMLHLFLQLADPWCISWSPRTDARIDPSQDQVQFFAREEAGRFVFRRANWYVPFSQFPSRAKGESAFAFYFRIEQWRRNHGIPDEVFATRADDHYSFEAKKRKPAWIHFSSPHALEVLVQLVNKDPAPLILTEVFPARNQHWIVSAPSSTVEAEDFPRWVSEFQLLLRWPIPAQQQRQTDEQIEGQGDEKKWLYFKIYCQDLSLLDQIVEQVLIPLHEKLIRSCEQIDRWFFLRFADAQGWHIRFRLRVPLREADSLSRQVQEYVLRLVNALAATNHNGAGIQVQTDLYEPELEKYGGVSGVALAERVFTSSSEVVLSLLRLEKQEAGFRQAAALLLMRELLFAAEINEQTVRSLLEFYFWYWTGRDALEAEQLRLSIAARAEQEYEQVEQLLRQIERLEGVEEALKNFRHVVREIARTCQCILPQHVYSLRQFCFDHIHLTNNRLGIPLADEGYLVALMLRFRK